MGAFMYEKEIWATTFYKIKERCWEKGAKRRWNLVSFEVGLTKLKRIGENVKWCVWFLKMIGVLHHALSGDRKNLRGKEQPPPFVWTHRFIFCSLVSFHIQPYMSYYYDCMHQDRTTFMSFLDDPILCPAR